MTPEEYLLDRGRSAPIVTEHCGISVARDDLYPGGTKARFFAALFEGADEVVYASPAEGGAQTALAYVAWTLSKRATIFVAARAAPHARTRMAARFGANIRYVRPGYLSTVKARARQYCDRTGAVLCPFGADLAIAHETISAAARATGLNPGEVWAAAGSGVLIRALAAAFPRARLHAVQIGRALAPVEVSWAQIHKYPAPFGAECKSAPPFPSDPHYDAKAWEVCQRERGPGPALFWNVTGPAEAKE